MTEARFDETIHAPLRLRICALLRRVDDLDFALLRDSLEVSDATLSKHIKTLTTAGYLRSHKTVSSERSDARRVMWLSLTRDGQIAFDGHMRALMEIAGTPL
ncbi:transcriptional regulator [Kocuria carniphila]|uniref:transcriptional regulator n=1 Tax=Kocuria carniphila TaxID=262208 RepID=UPI0028F02C2B|nr:transcriptional regulator [Kocuria carniphila]